MLLWNLLNRVRHHWSRFYFSKKNCDMISNSSGSPSNHSTLPTCYRGVVNSKKYPYTPVFLMKKYEKYEKIWKIWKNIKNIKIKNTQFPNLIYLDPTKSSYIRVNRNQITWDRDVRHVFFNICIHRGNAAVVRSFYLLESLRHICIVPRFVRVGFGLGVR